MLRVAALRSLTVATLVAGFGPGCGPGCGAATEPPDASPPAFDAGPAGDAATDPPDAGADATITPTARYFDDVTDGSGVTATREPTDDYLTLPDRMGGGVCVIDADGAAPLDLFFALRRGAGTGSRLYVGTSAFAYRDETTERGLDATGDALGCLAGDYDGDGDDDLLVTGVGGLRLFDNDRGSFTDVSARITAEYTAGAMYMSAAAGDVDQDGDLDLLVAGYQFFDPRAVPEDGCFSLPCTADVTTHVAVPNLLLIRGADGTYTNRAALSPDLSRPEPTLVVAIADMNDDGRANMYVGNDLGFALYDRVLERVPPAAGGDLATWRDIGEDLGLAYNGRGYGIDSMGWTMGDVDADGVFDFVVTSFEDDVTSLFLCGPPGPCAERGVGSGLEAGAESFRWGAALFDVDLDGDLDLFETAGHIYTDAEVADLGFSAGEQQRPNLFLNDGLATFTRVEPIDGAGLARAVAGRGVAVADLDDDGRLDVVVSAARGQAVVLRNVSRSAGHFLRVVLVGRGANRTAVGARVTVHGGARSFIRDRVLGEGYLGNFDPRLHFGLPAGVDRVTIEVRWPSGDLTRTTDVAVDRELVVTEE